MFFDYKPHLYLRHSIVKRSKEMITIIIFKSLLVTAFYLRPPITKFNTIIISQKLILYRFLKQPTKSVHSNLELPKTSICKKMSNNMFYYIMSRQ